MVQPPVHLLELQPENWQSMPHVQVCASAVCVLPAAVIGKKKKENKIK